MVVMAIIMDTRSITAIPAKAMAGITGAIITITIITPNATVTTGRGTTDLTGIIRHPAPAMDTDCTFPSLIPTSVSDSAPADGINGQVMSAFQHP